MRKEDENGYKKEKSDVGIKKEQERGKERKIGIERNVHLHVPVIIVNLGFKPVALIVSVVDDGIQNTSGHAARSASAYSSKEGVTSSLA